MVRLRLQQGFDRNGAMVFCGVKSQSIFKNRKPFTFHGLPRWSRGLLFHELIQLQLIRISIFIDPVIQPVYIFFFKQLCAGVHCGSRTAGHAKTNGL